MELNTDKQSSAIYRGVISLVVLEGALDFKTGQPPQFGKEKIQDDHIFPKSIYNDHRVVNRTLISTNAEKGSKKPSEYFADALKIHGRERLNGILKSHIIPEQALSYLLNDRKDDFLNERREAIINKLREKLRIAGNTS